MLFLVQYDRARGKIVDLQRFASTERDQAADARLKVELHLASQGELREVVLLEAETEDDLRVTHRRLFEDIPALMHAPRGETETDAVD